MASITPSSPIYLFSSEKILKSMKRFNINISKPDLDTLIKDSYSVQQVTDQLIRGYNPTDLIASNLYKFVEQYWEKTFPNQWSIEKVIQSMIRPIFTEGPLQQPNFENTMDLFNKISSLVSKMDFQSEIDSNSDFYEELEVWIQNVCQSFQDLHTDYGNQDIWKCFTEVKAFVTSYFSNNPNNAFAESVLLGEATLIYKTKSKKETFDFLDNIAKDHPFQEQILLHKLYLVKRYFDETIFLQVLLDIQIYLTTVEKPDEFVLRTLSEQLDDIKTIIPKFKDKIESTIVLLQKELDTILFSTDETSFEPEEHKNKSLELTEKGIWPKNATKIALDTLDKNFVDPNQREIFDGILAGEKPISLSFNCVTCGIGYDRDLKQILIPIDLGELRKNKTVLEDNGIILFSEEITCPICSSFKFTIETRSYFYITTIMLYIKKLEEEDEDLELDMESPVVIGDFKSNLVKEAKTIPEGIEKISKLLITNPENTKYLIGKGNMLLWMNDYNEGAKMFKKVLEMDKTNVEALFNLVKINFERKNINLSERYVNQIIEIIAEDKTQVLDNLRIMVGLDNILHIMKNRRLRKKFEKEINFYFNN